MMQTGGEPGRTLVLGLGNPLMTDDGLGLAALARLQEQYEFSAAVDFVDGGTWGMNLLHLIEAADRVLLIDAINVNEAPGSLITLERAQLPILFQLKLSPHQVDMRDVLAVAELRGRLPQDTCAIGLQPDRVELGTELSPLLEARMDVLLSTIVARLEVWGHASWRCAACGQARAACG